MASHPGSVVHQVHQLRTHPPKNLTAAASMPLSAEPPGRHVAVNDEGQAPAIAPSCGLAGHVLAIPNADLLGVGMISHDIP